MIAAVRGQLAGKTLDSALIAVGGVTLRVYAPLSLLSQLTAGDEAVLHTYLLVREDILALYGFATVDDRDLFEQLLQVGGVGPRVGLALLSSMSANALRDAVIQEDLNRLTLAPGVGKKLAARLVLELRPRFEKLGLSVPAGALVGAASPGTMRNQVVEALTGLGYSAADATAAVRALPDDASGTLEDLIFRALRSLARE